MLAKAGTAGNHALADHSLGDAGRGQLIALAGCLAARNRTKGNHA